MGFLRFPYTGCLWGSAWRRFGPLELRYHLSTGGPSSEYEELYGFFFYLYANVQRNVTWGIYYCLTTELNHAKRDSRLTAYGGVVLQRLEALNLYKVCMGTQRLCR